MGLLTRFRLRACQSVGRDPVVRGSIWVHGSGSVRLGDRVVLDARSAPIELRAVDPGAEIVLGDDVHIEGGASIEAVQSVTIGARAHLGWFSKIMDSNFHSMTGDRHRRPTPYPVVVGEDVRIEARALLLPGSRVGAQSTVASMAVVTRHLRILPGSLVRGHPAVVVR
jgi:acetyltransferase-like isoleucine patch superfamily enzyme